MSTQHSGLISGTTALESRRQHSANYQQMMWLNLSLGAENEGAFGPTVGTYIRSRCDHLGKPSKSSIRNKYSNLH